tara:strand:- start:829 stop:1035 length:207 start_codon:yes stop_codon:yes gene_type:complete
LKQYNKQKKGNKMSRLNIKEASIEELEEECENVLGTPYGHNIIGLICNVVDERFGEEEANRFFETYQM